MKRKAAHPSRTPNHKIKVLLIDDQTLVVELLRHYLVSQQRYRVVGIAADRASALVCAQETHPDVAIIDLLMPRLDGLEATRQLLKVCPSLRVIAYRPAEDEKAFWALLRAGARGCLSKAAGASELVGAIETVCRGEIFLSQAILTRLASCRIEDWADSTKKDSRSLTGSEVRIIKRVADGLCNKEIAGALNMSIRTVEKYRESIKLKLRLRSVAELTKFAVRTGLSALE